MSGIALPLERDDVDEDSVYYEYGFEDDWSGWTTADLTNPGPLWHPSEQHAFEEGSSWWCAIEDLGGYDNHWLQYLITPALDLRDFDSVCLNFMVFWAMEDPEVNPPDPQDWPEYDAWDGFNLWISTDGGEEWEIIEPERPAYNYESLFSFGYEWGMGPGIPGWCGFSGEWLEAVFNLDEYAGRDDVRIRWAFCSDPADATPDNDEYLSCLVDNLEIFGDDELYWSNNGDEQGDMEFDVGPSAGDHWELSEEESHTGDISAHCPIEPNLQDALVSPPLEIPEDPWYTWFDFWIIADGQNYDPDNNNSLDDYYMVEVSEDGVRWEKIIHDYGRGPDWWDDWHFYGPDTTYNDAPSWKRKLNLTGFGGETIWLRWKIITDDIMGDEEGSGFWLDDFRINITNRPEHDVGIEWVHIPYPNAVDLSTRCQISVKNFGLADENFVQRYFQVDNLIPRPIVPWGPLESDSSLVQSFVIEELPYADSVNVAAWAQVNHDNVPENDRRVVEGVVVYPEGVYNLGYDNRTYNFIGYRLDRNSGPMVKYTPEDDGIEGSFDLMALRARWDGTQQGDVQTTLHIFDDLRGDIGDEIYSSEITVTQQDLLPFVHVIDLADVQQLKEMSDDFWVWFELLNDNHFPAITGDEQAFGEEHYFTYDGELLRPFGADLQLHATIMPAGAGGTELVAGRETMDFEAIQPNTRKLMRLALFNGGIEPVTISDFDVNSELFDVEPALDLPMTLNIGDIDHFFVTFMPDQEGEFEAELTFTSNDDEPPVVRLIGVGDDLSSSPTDPERIPTEFSLGSVYPNPFNGTTVIPFEIARTAEVNLTVFDLSGRRVATLVSGRLDAGRHEAVFEAGDLSAGVYLYNLNTGTFTMTRKVVMVK